MIAKPRKNPQNARIASGRSRPSGCCRISARMSKVGGDEWKYTIRIASSIASDPTSVYRKNLIAA